MEKSSSDALAPDELLLSLEQVSDAPFAADAAFVSPAPVDAPLVCLPYQEVRSEVDLAAAHVDTRPNDRQGHGGDVLGTDSAVAEPMSAIKEPTFSPEECDMLLLVLQGTASEAEDHGDAKDDACSEQARSIGGGCYCTSSSGLGSESSVSGSSVTARGARQGTHRNDEGELIMDALSAMDSHPKAQQAPRRKQAKRPNRRRRKHDINELRDQVQELIKELVRLRVQGQPLVVLSQIQQQQGGAGNKLLEMEASVEPSAWQLAAVSEREKTRVAVLENARLRTQYEQQLQILQRLQAMARNQFDFAVRRSPVWLFSVSISWVCQLCKRFILFLCGLASPIIQTCSQWAASPCLAGRSPSVRDLIRSTTTSRSSRLLARILTRSMTRSTTSSRPQVCCTSTAN